MASAVTYEMVEDVCNHLAAGGESPTYLKVHQRLGKGSTRIVSAYIRQWREAHALSKALERDPLFGEWPEALQLKARSLFDGLLALSAEAANASAESQRLSFEERERVLAAKAQEAARLADDALDKLRSEQAESARLAVEIRSLEAAVEGRQDMVSDLIEQRALQELRLVEAAERLEALRAEHAQQITRLAEEAAAERKRLLEEIRLEQERAGGERELLMRQTDRLRQDHVAAVEELRLRVAKLDGALTSQRQKNEEAEQRASALAASRQQLEETVAAAERRSAGLEDELARLRARQVTDAARLGGQETQISMLMQQLEREAQRTLAVEERLQALTLQQAAPPALLPAPAGPGAPEGGA
jgi:chromosome segregation ATPase